MITKRTSDEYYWWNLLITVIPELKHAHNNRKLEMCRPTSIEVWHPSSETNPITDFHTAYSAAP